MKKIISLIISSFLCFNLCAQENWGEASEWKNMFYTYLAANNLQLNENQESFLIKKYYYKEWQQYHNDEFEWEDHKQNNLKEINEAINSYKDYKDKKFYTILRKEFGKYDFDKKGYTVEISETSYIPLEKPFVNDSEYSERSSVPDMAIWLNNFSKYNLFPMEKDKAKIFQDERKDRYGEIDRTIYLVIHYTLEDFSSPKYKEIAKTFQSTEFQPVVGNISSIEVYNEKSKKIGDLIKN